MPAHLHGVDGAAMGKSELPGKIGPYQLSVTSFRVMKEGRLRAQGRSASSSPCPTATGGRDT